MNSTATYHIGSYYPSMLNSVDTNIWLFGCAALWTVFTHYIEHSDTTDYRIAEASRFTAIRDVLLEMKNDLHDMKVSLRKLVPKVEKPVLKVSERERDEHT